MKATFRFSNIEATIPVAEFNSVRAALAWTLPTHGACTVEFDTDQDGWINEPSEQRERTSRSKWLDDCMEGKARHNESLVPSPPGELGPSNREIAQRILQARRDPSATFAYLESFACIVARVHKMGVTFEVPMNDKPTDLGPKRIEDFIENLAGTEHGEIWELRTAVSKYPEEDGTAVDLTVIADTLGDIIVYCLSEANRWGIPIIDVLHAILDSQDSKLEDGKPVWNEGRTKFIKGPNYVAPEPVIEQIVKNAQLDSLEEVMASEIFTTKEKLNERFEFEGEGIN